MADLLGGWLTTTIVQELTRCQKQWRSKSTQTNMRKARSSSQQAWLEWLVWHLLSTTGPRYLPSDVRATKTLNDSDKRTRKPTQESKCAAVDRKQYHVKTSDRPKIHAVDVSVPNRCRVGMFSRWRSLRSELLFRGSVFLFGLFGHSLRLERKLKRDERAVLIDLENRIGVSCCEPCQISARCCATQHWDIITNRLE